ncbi:hypothetical protein N7513_010865 [Penicillium frequentans]|nr:hypothetical protein N7513_010865 [Penicillium glabrum]
MHFFPLILASIFAAAATTALPHDTLPNGLSLRQDSSCAAAMSAEEVAREKLDNDKRERARIPPQVSGAQVYRDRLDLQNAQNNVLRLNDPDRKRLVILDPTIQQEAGYLDPG